MNDEQKIAIWEMVFLAIVGIPALVIGVIWAAMDRLG